MLRRWSKKGADHRAADAAASAATGPLKRDAYDDKLDDELKELDRE
jgi:hypothetical protein